MVNEKIVQPRQNLKMRTKFFAQISKIGKALLFPIAVLPVAAILLRIGSQVPTDTLFSQFVNKMLTFGGNVVFNNLPILFAIGLGFGLAKDNRGEAALCAFVGMSLLTLLLSSNGADLPNLIYGKLHFKLAPGLEDQTLTGFHRIFGNKYNDILANNVLNGIIAGSFVAYLYNRFNGTSLPKVLGFFSGRRLIPVLAILSILFLSLLYAIIYPWIGFVIYQFSMVLTTATGNRWGNASIMGIYIIINRLLIPFGMHHIPNTLFWFSLGEHVDSVGNIVHGDINIFLNGIAKGNHAGTFQSGFFPMMMFGLPALVGGIYTSSESKEQKKRVLSMFLGSVIVSILTGITEPIEFTFLFVAMPLFITHALVGAIFAFITGAFGIQLGFGFSAGLIDYLLSLPKSFAIIDANLNGISAVLANPLWILIIGPLCSFAYFYASKFVIKTFNLQTPGRGNNLILQIDENESVKESISGRISAKAAKIVLALGGWNNITSYQNCATRLRYDVKDMNLVEMDNFKKLNLPGAVKVGANQVQIIVGPQVELLNDEIISFKGTNLDDFMTKKNV